MLAAELTCPRFAIVRTWYAECFESRMNTKIGNIVALETEVFLSVSSGMPRYDELNNDFVRDTWLPLHSLFVLYECRLESTALAHWSL